MNFRTIYDTRISMLSINPEDIKNNISRIDPSLEVINNTDRTLYIKSKNNIYDNKETFDKSISDIIGSKCNPSMLYNMFVLNENSCLIKI